MEEPADENSNSTAVLGEDVVLREREQLSDLLHLLPLRAQLGFSGLKDKWNNRGDKGLKDMISVAAKTNDPLMVEYTCLDVTSKSIVFGSNLGIVYMYDRATRRLSKFICDVSLFFFDLGFVCIHLIIMGRQIFRAMLHTKFMLWFWSHLLGK